jgi:formylglycine-generating enzyme required for sulfatase activity
MKIIFRTARPLVLAALTLGSLTASTLAQEIIIPDPNFNAVIREALQKPNGPLTQADMLSLTNLGAVFRNITNVQGLETAQNLVSLDLQDNRITSFNFPTNLTKLTVLDLSENRFPTLTLPGLTNLTTLRLEYGRLTNLSLSAGMTKLTSLRAGFNQLASLTLPADMTNLSLLSVFQNQLTNLTLPPKLTNLSWLDLDGNRLSSLNLPSGLTNLSVLIVSGNQLTSFSVPADMTNLTALRINDNQLTNLTLSTGLNQLSLLVVSGNQLRSLTFPPGLTSLAFLDLSSNQLSNITLPPDLQQSIGLFMAGNPLTTFVLSEPLAATGMASVVDSLQRQGVSVFTYPLAVRLASPHRMSAAAIELALSGPPGSYAILSSTNLTAFSALGTATNTLGSAIFTDVQAQLSSPKFYRARLLTPPTNMVFIPPNTFTMGSPTNEQDRNMFTEGPQATVTLTHGFWIGKFEVTQGEYLSIMNTNPSNFPGDLGRAVEGITWFDATNYCWQLTQRELAAGRILIGSKYRLPTEAEWECAAHAGTTTRFSYGDDPSYASLTNYAWFLDLGHPDLIVHPVGEKLPNPWGLYDMSGNVWEWCQDWYGDQQGGIQTDPQGPASNAQALKVMRGGAYDYSFNDCRSASRLFRFANWSDSDVGFRVVLISEP